MKKQQKTLDSDVNRNDPLEAITHICNIRQSVYGLDYLQELIGRFSALYEVEFALIGRPKNQPLSVVETEVLLSNGAIQDNIVYELAGTPCETVLGGDRVCLYEDGVSKQFPADTLLQDMGVNAYLGSRLLSPEGKALGLLVFMSAKPIRINEAMFTVLDFIASRAGMELEREDLNYQLEMKTQKENRQKRLASLGQLINGVAHDFNNLLAGILGHIELLEMKLGDDQNTKLHVDGVLKSIMRARNLTGQLMDFSNPQPKRDVTTNVGKVVDEIKQLVVPNLTDSVSFKNETPDCLNVKIDGSHLQQVLLNIVLNANDAMPEGGEISISAEEVPKVGSKQEINPEVRIQIRDTGFGISKQDIDHVFDPFFTTKDVGKGTGLGLASAYSIIQIYGGSIYVESELTKGTTFSIVLPGAGLDAETEQTNSANANQFNGYRVLIAEDEEAIASTLSELLRLKGFVVTVASDGEQARDLIQAHADKSAPFQIVVADLNMPKLNGEQLRQFVQENHPNTQFVLSTGEPSALDMTNLTTNENCQVLIKPFSFATLLEKLEGIREVIEGDTNNP